MSIKHLIAKLAKTLHKATSFKKIAQYAIDVVVSVRSVKTEKIWNVKSVFHKQKKKSENFSISSD